MNKPLSIAVARTIGSRDLDALKEILQAPEFASGKLARGENLWLLTSTKKIQAKRDEFSVLVHSTGRDVDID
jgi:hypothetical protein